MIRQSVHDNLSHWQNSYEPTTTMEDLNDLYYFTEVAQRGGFSAAARALQIPKSRLSRRIAELEQRLGARLMQRSTRRLHLTPIGEDFLARCKAMVVEAQAAQELIERGVAEPRGRLRVSCPIQLAQGPLAQALPAFQARFSKVQIELEATNRRVDVIAEGIDVAIRARAPSLQSAELVSKPLGISRRYLVASRALVESIGTPQTLADLHRYPSLGQLASDGRYFWKLNAPDGETALFEHHPRLITDDMMVLRQSAIAGVGIVQLPQLLCEDDLSSGRLVILLPEWKAESDLIHAAYFSRRQNIPAVQEFLRFLGEQISPLLPQPD